MANLRASLKDQAGSLVGGDVAVSSTGSIRLRSWI